MKSPNAWQVSRLLQWCSQCSTCIDGRYMPARPIGGGIGPFWRMRQAWAVFTGKADALYWPGGQ